MTEVGGAASLRRRALRGVAWTAAERWLVRLAGLATFIVLGRLLQPEAFGVVALASSIIALIQVLTEVGFATWLLQLDEVSPRDINTAFWTGLAMAGAAAGALYTLAGSLASLLDSPQLGPVLRVLSLVLILGGLGSVPTALLTRELRFRELALRQVSSILAGAAVGITVAFLGGSVWALVAQAVTQAGVQVVVLYVTARWLPRFTWSRTSAREMVDVGSKAIGVGALQQFRDQGETLLIGSVMGVSALGYWSIATRLYSVIIDVGLSIVTSVATPLFVKLRHDPARLGTAYRLALSGAALVVGPGVVGLAVLSPYLLPLVFGQQWTPSVNVAAVLALGGVILASSFFDRPVFLAARRLGTQVKLLVVTVGVHLALVPLVGAHFGLVALALAVTIAELLFWPIRIVLLRRTCGLRPAEQWDSVRVFLACLLAGLATLGVREALGLDVTWPALVLLAAIFLLFVVGSFALIARGIIRSFVRVGRSGGEGAIVVE